MTSLDSRGTSFDFDSFEDATDSREIEDDTQEYSLTTTTTTTSSTKTSLSRSRSKSEIKELKDVFDRADKAKSGEIDRKSLREVLESDETRAVRRAKSGKFDVEELESLAEAIDVDKSGTTTFNELVQVLGAAETLSESPKVEDQKNAETENDEKESSVGSNEKHADVSEEPKKTEHEDWEAAERKYTTAALDRHRRNSAARRSVTMQKKSSPVADAKEKKNGDERTAAHPIVDDDKASVRVPSIRVDETDCACACLVM